MNTAVTRNDWVGRVIDGRFPLLEWLGSTEQAGVFRTELEEPQPRRAVVRLMPAHAEDAPARLRDWASAARLSHPHLMRIFESGRAQVGGVELLYVVTEYADESLAQVIPERPLSTVEAGEMLVPILDALTYLHAQGIVHGRIKPSNIMVIHDRLKLPVDGVRPAVTEAPAQLTMYSAPEAASGAISPAADIWSLGMTLVEALAQHPPLWDRSTRRDPVVPAEIPSPFADIARGCLRRDPARRATLREIRTSLSPARSLDEPANEIDQIAPAEIAPRAHETSEGPQSRRRIAAIVAGVIVVLAVIAFVVMRSHRPQPWSPTVAHSTAPAVTQPPAQSPQAPPPSGGTTRGTVAKRVMPDTLAKANRTIHGKVEVKIRLNAGANGRVSNARFDSPGHSRYFANQALEAARKWSFKPAQVNGQAVPSVWILRFEFKPGGPGVTAAEVSP